MKNYSDETISNCIAMLLRMLDKQCDNQMHWYGQTPDWYVCAAMVSCDIPDNSEEASRMIADIVEQQRNDPSN